MSQAVTVSKAPSEARAPVVAGAGVQALVPRNMEEAFRIATAIARSGMAPKDFKDPEAILVAIMHGMEIGLPPMAALQSIAVVNGRPTVWGDGLVGLVRGSGLCEWIRDTFEGDGDTLTAVCETQRKGEPHTIIATFSVADAKKAGLWGKGGPWSNYPKRMLKNRARTFALRDAYADVLRGVTDREEAADTPVEHISTAKAETSAEARALASLAAPISDAAAEGVSDVADDAAISQDAPDTYWPHYAAEIERDFAKHKTVKALADDYQDAKERMENEGAPDDIRQRVTNAKIAREAAILDSRK